MINAGLIYKRPRGVKSDQLLNPKHM